MKVVIVILTFLGVILPSVWGVEEDALFIASETMEKLMEAAKQPRYDSERFYPDFVKSLNVKMYGRRKKGVPMEKRIRNILLNQYIVVPNDRTGNKTSSYVKLMNGNRSTFFIYNSKDGQQIVEAFSSDAACLFGMSEDRTAVKAKACRRDVSNMKWQLIPNKFGDFWIQQAGTDLCLAPVRTMSYPTLVQLAKCDRWDPYIIWEISDAYLYYKK